MDPKNMTQDQRQSLWVQAGHAGTAPVGYGGESGGGGGDSGVGGYLNNLSNVLHKAEGVLNQTPEEQMQQLRQNVSPGPTPQPVSLVKTFSDLISSSGVQDLEKSATDLKQQINDVQTGLKSQQAREEGTPGLTMDVVAGRETEEQRQGNIRLDSLNLRLGVITDQLNQKYSVINTMVQLTGQDYQNAVQAYDAQFQRNMSLYSAVQGQRQEAAQEVVNISGQEIQYAQQQQQTAAANLGVYSSLIQSNSLSFDKLDPQTKLAITKMEVQSGLGIGFLQSIQQHGTLLYADKQGALMQQPDGSLKVIPLPGGSGGGSGSGYITSKTLPGAISEMDQKLGGAANSYGNVSPEVWQQGLQAWNDAGGKTSDFVNNFKHYADPNRGDFSSAYGFPASQRATQKRSTSQKVTNLPLNL